ncbi:MAG: Rossmann-like domain-containing protein [Terracidiphilus sp.]
MTTKWKLYDDLIASVPEDSMVSGCLAGLSWFLVRSAGVGVAMRPREGDEVVPMAGRLAGRKTRELAQLIKSWKPYEAALGLAAINSVLNAPDAAHRNCGDRLDACCNQDVFTVLLDELRGKRVAVVGHFYNMERVAAICDLSILERMPEAGDWPDPACEYILPEQDFVIMTATTLINKTMPRLLELSKGARIVVCGPSTPLSPIFFDYGVELLGGLIVEEPERVWNTVAEGGRHELFRSGSRMVMVSRIPLAARV